MQSKYSSIVKISHFNNNNKPDITCHEFVLDLKKENYRNYTGIRKINYKCLDKIGYVYIHESITKDNEYFSTIFELNHDNELNLNFDFSEKSFLYVLDVFYDVFDETTFNFDCFVDIFRALTFFCMSDEREKLLRYVIFDSHELIFTKDNFVTIEELFIRYQVNEKYLQYIALKIFDKSSNITKYKCDEITVKDITYYKFTVVNCRGFSSSKVIKNCLKNTSEKELYICNCNSDGREYYYFDPTILKLLPDTKYRVHMYDIRNELNNVFECSRSIIIDGFNYIEKCCPIVTPDNNAIFLRLDVKKIDNDN